MRRELLLGFLAFALIAVCLRVLYVQNGNVIYDEYQHMHAAYLVASGQTPFLDFFEHHTPLFYYFAALVIPLDDPSFDTLIVARYLSLAFHLATVVIAMLWVRRFAGWGGGLLVAVLLLAHVRFLVWGCRTYLDTFAAPFLLLSALALPVRRADSRRAFCSALFLGIAILFTQKAVFAGFAPVAVFLCRAARELPDRERRGSWFRDLSAYALGAVFAMAALPLLLGWDGSQAFIRDAVILNMNWRARHSAARELWELARSDAFIGVVAVLWMAVLLGRVTARRFALAPADIPSLFLLATSLGIVLLPVVWEEYFVLLLPFAVIVAGQCLQTWWRAGFAPSGSDRFALLRRALVALFLVTTTAELWLLIRPLERHLPRFDLAILCFVPAVWIVGIVLATRVCRRRQSWVLVLWLAVFLAFPLSIQALWVRRHSNHADRERVEFVMQRTAPTEPVFDGRSGFGVFRPHAYRYWFLHDEMQVMLTDAEKSAGIIRALELQRPPVAIVDSFTRMLPEAVLDYIATHYVESPFPEIRVRAEGR